MSDIWYNMRRKNPMFKPELLNPNDPIDAISIRARKEREEYLLTGSNEQIKREATEVTKKPVERREASRRENVPPAQETRSTGKFERPASILRDRWIVIATIIAIAAIVVAYIIRPSRYRVMGEHNRYILDSQTGKAYHPSGLEVKYP